MGKRAQIALAVLAGVLTLLLFGTGVVVVAQGARLARASDRISDLQAELDGARERIAELEQRVAAGTEPSAPDAPRADEPGDGGGLGDALGELGRRFGELFGGDGDGSGDLGELFDQLPPQEDPQADQLACATPDEQVDGPAIPKSTAAAQVDAIADWVTALRKLDFEKVPEPQLLTGAQVNRRIQADLDESYPPAKARAEERMLQLLGALPPDVDLRKEIGTLLAAQVAGFYDPDTSELVVRTNDPSAPLSTLDQITMAHELQHALADQALDLPVDVTESTSDTDGALAALALIEGDATLTMQRFALSALDPLDQLRMLGDPRTRAGQQELEAAPYVLRRALIFPYEQGLAFACAQYRSGGWNAVNRAYERLPSTTAEVLWPERYERGEPAQDPEDLSRPSGYEQALRSTFGAADLLWLFEAPGDDEAAQLSDAMQRAAAWAGGEQALFTDGERAAGGISLVRRPGEADLCSSMVAWLRAARPESRQSRDAPGERLALTGEPGGAVVRCKADQVRVGLADDLATARAVIR